MTMAHVQYNLPLNPGTKHPKVQSVHPLEGHQFTEPVAALKFIFGGKATFTLRSLKTGDHITFKCTKHKERDDLFFIKARRSTSTSGGFNYLAYFKGNAYGGTLRTSNKSVPLGNAFVALEWVVGNLMASRLPHNLQIWHEGRCAACARPLTDPESIARGFGPECWKKG